MQPGTFHQYRVTPVTVDGVLGSRASHWTYASPEPGRFEAPKEVRVIYEEGRNRKVTATIALKHSVDLPSCYYAISLLPSSETASARFIRRTQPYDLFQNDLIDLDFAVNYTMTIRSTDSTGTVHSKREFTRWFETPPCLDAFNYNFSVCGKQHLLWQPRQDR